MKSLTSRQRIVGSFLLILATMVVMRAVTLTRLGKVDVQVRALQTDSLPGLDQAVGLLSDAETNFSLLKTSVTSKQPGSYAELSPEFGRNAAAMNNLERLYANALAGEQDRATFDAYVKARQSYDRATQTVLGLNASANTKEAARATFNAGLSQEFGTMRRALQSMVAFNGNNATSSAAAIDAAVSAAKFDVFLSFLLPALMAIACAFFLTKDMIETLRRLSAAANRIAAGDLSAEPARAYRKDEMGALAAAFDRMVVNLKSMAHAAEQIAAGNLNVDIVPLSAHDVMGNALANMTKKLSTLVSDIQRSGVRVTSSVTELAATAKQQRATASGTAATATEIGATSTEIYATSRELVKTMGEVAAVAEETSMLAGTGQSSLLQMGETMQNVLEAGGSINEKLIILNEKAANINQVVTTITRIADQTNLLSLNAAIEAEKAGDYGRGFSVVATEIRRLADQTAVATYDIEQTVRDILSAISAGVTGMDKFSEAVRNGEREVTQIGSQLTQIIDRVQALAPRVESVSEGMQLQAVGAEQITEALRHLTEAAQQTVESLQMSSEAVDELNRVSTSLHTGVSTFRVAA